MDIYLPNSWEIQRCRFFLAPHRTAPCRYILRISDEFWFPTVGFSWKDRGLSKIVCSPGTSLMECSSIGIFSIMLALFSFIILERCSSFYHWAYTCLPSLRQLQQSRLIHAQARKGWWVMPGKCPSMSSVSYPTSIITFIARSPALSIYW